MFRMVANFHERCIFEVFFQNQAFSFLFVNINHWKWFYHYVFMINFSCSSIVRPFILLQQKLYDILQIFLNYRIVLLSLFRQKKNIICIVKRILCNNSLCYINLYYWLEKNTNSFSFAKNEKEKTHSKRQI